MDFMSINDLVFECIRAFVLIILLTILFLRGNFTSLGRHPGWKFILAGFCLITFATLLDITDEIPGLEKYIVIGDTIYEAFIEKLPGYLLGFVLLLFGFYKMIPSLQKSETNEQALHESEERFRQIFVANPDPVILARLETGAIIDLNPAFEEQAGFNRDEVIGKNSAELDLWADPEMREVFRSKLKENGIIDNYETEFKIKDGTIHPALMSARIVNVSDQPCILIVIRDITKIKAAEKALIEVDQIRSEFISMAAHELRTPLSVLIGYAELLATPESFDKFSDQKRLEFLEEIKQKGLVLSQIIDDLLDISRMDGGLTFELQYSSVNPDELMRQTFKHFQVHSPHHRFCLDLTLTGEDQLECDEKRILQVLENLLGNATKYSPEGSHITLTGNDQGDTFELSVSDDGIGMTQEQIEKIFDKFYRADSSNTAVGGLGLGMSIVKQIIDAHKGTISIDSTPDKGSCFKIRLPKNRPD